MAMREVTHDEYEKYVEKHRAELTREIMMYSDPPCEAFYHARRNITAAICCLDDHGEVLKRVAPFRIYEEPTNG